jgi:hypothetical protein
LIQVCRALVYAHERAIVHQDVSRRTFSCFRTER